MSYKVEFSAHFTITYDDLPEDQQELIDDFVFHFRRNGLNGYKGKFGPTDNVPEQDPDRVHKIWYANRHKLWHAHIGHPYWVRSHPLAKYETSDYVVHFQRLTPEYIALVEYGHHNPMAMPEKKSLFKHY